MWNTGKQKKKSIETGIYLNTYAKNKFSKSINNRYDKLICIVGEGGRQSVNVCDTFI